MNLLILISKNKYVQGGIIGLIIGFLIGAKIVGMENAEAIRQLVQVIQIATGG